MPDNREKRLLQAITFLMPITAQRGNNYRTYNIRESGMKKAKNSSE